MQNCLVIGGILLLSASIIPVGLPIATAALINVGDSMFVYVPNIRFVASGTYSGVVSCDQEVAAVSNWSDSDSGASYSGVSAPGTTWYAPNVYDNYYNYYTTTLVQNASSSPVDITVSIYPPGSSTPVSTVTHTSVPAYATSSFEQEALAGLNNNVAYSGRRLLPRGTWPRW